MFRQPGNPQFSSANETTLPTVLNTNRLAEREGVSSISDSEGELLLYTNGNKVYNHDHEELMAVAPNGEELQPIRSATAVSSTQGALIAKVPGSTTKYYIFTNCSGGQGIYYAIADMDRNAGKGALLADDMGNVQTRLQAPGVNSEKFTATYSGDGLSYWLVGHSFEGNSFYVWNVSKAGIVKHSVFPQNIGFSMANQGPYNIDNPGYLKFSPTGKILASANFSNGISVVGFDVNTGKITEIVKNNAGNPLPLLVDPENEVGYFYGLEFSPNEDWLYYTRIYNRGVPSGSYSPGAIHRVRLNFNAPFQVNKGIETVYEETKSEVGFSAIQTGPDGRMYVCRIDERDTLLDSYLSYITNPDENDFSALNFSNQGLKVNLTNNAVSNPAFARLGLPNVLLPHRSNETSISKNNEKQFHLYPNPAVDKVSIALESSAITGVKITDLSGKLVMNTTLSEYRTELQITDLEPGVYFFQFVSNTGKILGTEKVIIQH